MPEDASLALGVAGGDGDGVEDAEAHAAAGGGVVVWPAEEQKAFVALPASRAVRGGASDVAVG